MQPRPILIGITGGIGSGKSTLLDAFVRRGASSFSADGVVHELYDDPEVLAAVREHWGDRVIDASGRVDRASVASIVFTDTQERRWLEALLHPLVGEAWLRFVAKQRALPEPPELIVAEVPLLFEAGLEDRYDVVVVVTAPHALRLERGGHLHGAERAAAQLPEHEKVARADFSFANTGSRDELDSFVEHVINEVRGQGAKSYRRQKH